MAGRRSSATLTPTLRASVEAGDEGVVDTNAALNQGGAPMELRLDGLEALSL
jgi:hypothetical protein